MTVKKGWNWLTADVDPIPGTKEFNKEWLDVKTKYFRLKKKKEEYNETVRKIR
jgi:2-methylcitrate dehydratase PrpD